jgi:hypothetical protein
MKVRIEFDNTDECREGPFDVVEFTADATTQAGCCAAVHKLLEATDWQASPILLMELMNMDPEDLPHPKSCFTSENRDSIRLLIGELLERIGDSDPASCPS